MPKFQSIRYMVREIVHGRLRARNYVVSVCALDAPGAVSNPPACIALSCESLIPSLREKAGCVLLSS